MYPVNYDRSLTLEVGTDLENLWWGDTGVLLCFVDLSLEISTLLFPLVDLNKNKKKNKKILFCKMNPPTYNLYVKNDYNKNLHLGKNQSGNIDEVG